jgi:hypothetical protein
MQPRSSLIALAFATALTATAVAAPTSAGAPQAPARSEVCSPNHLKNCPRPGTYLPGGGDQIIFSNEDFDIQWAWSTVEAPPPGQVPQYFYVNVRYTNRSPNIEYFTCKGWEDPALSKEWFYRNGKAIGYVPADHTLCSDHPDTNFTVAPDRSFISWARFHNVPWRGDQVAIEWGQFGSGNHLNYPYAYLNPYASGPTK